LVSEILSLRRDQEEKLRLIEGLETDLHNTRGEREEWDAALQTTAKENRSLKRQLALLEGGTSSALSALAKERDEAVDAIAETKRRLEVAQKKVRNLEDNADRAQALWTKDKDNWEEEKRKYERRIHVADGRLKAVLDEVAAFQASHQNGQPQEVEAEEQSRDLMNGAGSDTASVRTMSLTNSIRFSVMAGVNGHGGTKLNGVSLADELDLDDDYDDQTDDHDGRESVLSVRHNRTQSRESVISRQHRRNQSLESLMRPASVARGRLLANQVTIGKREGGILEDDETLTPKKPEYNDAGVQYSPPPSPKLAAAAIETQLCLEPTSLYSISSSGKPEKLSEQEQPARELEIEANQRRKRVHAHPTLALETLINPNSSMAPAASQTLEDPPSPPRTPMSPTRAPPPPPLTESAREMSSASTQTDAPEIPPQSSRRAAPPAPIAVPSIQLHPPSSAPTTPRESLLPQHSKDAGCQVSMPTGVPTRSVSVQTEEIRVDLRMNLLPPHLQPSAISSKPPSPEPFQEPEQYSPIPGNLPPRNPRRVKSATSINQDIASSPPQNPETKTRDAYPGNNDDGPLAKDKGPIRRPHRVSSLFAGFDNASSDDAEDFADADMSDNDYRTALSAPRPQSRTERPGMGKRIPPAPPTSVPENMELTKVARPQPNGISSAKQISRYDSAGEYNSADAQSLPQKPAMRSTRQLDKPLTLTTAEKPGTMRRAALIQSGVAAHQGRSRSPSLPDPPVREPPFPIPTRASSRNPPISSSAPSDGNRSPTWARGSGRGHYRVGSVRKVRSAAALPRGGRTGRRHGSRSPPPLSPSTEAPESPRLPPLPNNDVTSPRYMKDTANSRYRSHRQQPSANTTNTANTYNTNYTANTTHTGGESATGSNQATTVVDAIAQTMVGEWMFKYVRRRKSFGVGESTGVDGENGNGVRHKRWVWLAPYERAVMWSSKQPTSGSALLGKSGRKRKLISPCYYRSRY
jgi:hypothetical protein